MHISELRLQNFKKFNQAKFVFTKGINVIKGANEQGKSTILEALIAGLFIDPASSRAKDKSKSWNTENLPVIEIDYFTDGKFYAIVKDFGTKQVEFTDVLAKSKVQDMKSVEKYLQDHIGVSSEALLRATACVNHDQMSQIEEGKKSLEEALQEASFLQGKVSVIDLLRNLGTKIDQMQVGLYRPAKNNGVIKELSNQYEEGAAELKNLKEKEQGVEVASDKLKSLLKEQTDVDAQIEKYTKIVADYEKRESIEKELSLSEETIKSSTADLTRVRDFKEKVEALSRKITALGGEPLLGLFDANQDKVLSLNKNIQSKQDELNKMLISKPEPKKVKKRFINYQFVLVAILSIILIVIGVIINLLALIITGIIVGLVGITLVSFMQSDKLEDSADEVHSYGVQNLQRELDDNRSQLQAILSECRVETPEEFYSKRTQMIAAHSDLVQTKSTMEAIMRGRSIEEVQKIMDEAIQKKRELELQLPEGSTVTKEQYTKDKRELELLNLDKKDIINEIAEEKAKVTVSDVNPKMIEEKEEKLKKVEVQLEEAKHKLEVLQVIFDNLSKAKDEISSNVSENIQKFASNTLPKITNGRYTSIKLDSNFKLEVYSNEKNDWIRPDDHVSKGTIDQIYLSARLALADVLTDGKPVPLFFDDPFVTFDATRRNALVEELKQISQSHQVFIFTCHDFFDEVGNVVNVAEE